jgi:hypothetical protein
MKSEMDYDQHDDRYVSDDYIGVHHKHMRMKSFMAVSALILSIVAVDIEDNQYWNSRAVDAKMIWC